MKKILWWKTIEELNDELNHFKRNEKELEKGIKRQKEQIDKLKSMLRGERVCDGYCVNCEHHLSENTCHNIGFGITERVRIITCALDCKCPDFKRKETT